MEIERFYTGKKSLMQLLNGWLDEPETQKIEIHCIRIDEFSTWIWRQEATGKVSKILKTDEKILEEEE